MRIRSWIRKRVGSVGRRLVAYETDDNWTIPFGPPPLAWRRRRPVYFESFESLEAMGRSIIAITGNPIRLDWRGIDGVTRAPDADWRKQVEWFAKDAGRRSGSSFSLVTKVDTTPVDREVRIQFMSSSHDTTAIYGAEYDVARAIANSIDEYSTPIPRLKVDRPFKLVSESTREVVNDRKLQKSLAVRASWFGAGTGLLASAVFKLVEVALSS